VPYGVQPEHYHTVGAALLWALEQECGAAFTSEVREAWATAYSVLAEIMTTAAGEPPRPAQPRPTGHEPRVHQKCR
jgi:hemoglobin-like flavoprotein